MNVCPPHLKSCSQLELISQLFESRRETRMKQRMLLKVEASAHVAPTVILQCITFCCPSVLQTTQQLSASSPLAHFPKEHDFFIFQGQISFQTILTKVLSCITAFPWPLQDDTLQRTKDLIFSWNALGHVERLSIRCTVLCPHDLVGKAIKCPFPVKSIYEALSTWLQM